MTAPTEYPDRTHELTATIAVSATTSDTVDLGGCSLIGIFTPSSITGTALKFRPVNDSGTDVPLYTTGGSEVSYTVAASRYMPIDPDTFRGIQKLKLVSGSAEAAERAITLVVKP